MPPPPCLVGSPWTNRQPSRSSPATVVGTRHARSGTETERLVDTYPRCVNRLIIAGQALPAEIQGCHSLTCGHMRVDTFSSVTGHISERRFTVNRHKPNRLQGVYMQVLDPKKIKKLMVVQEVSARQLAGALGYRSHAYIGRILRGEIKTVTPTKAAQISAYFGMPMDELFAPRVSSDTRQNGKRH